MKRISRASSLQLVDGNFPKSRARQRLPESLLQNGRPEFKVLSGGWRKPWLTLSPEQRTTQVRLTFDTSSGLYTLTISRDGDLLETRIGKRTQRGELSLWLERSEGRKVRIPWLKVEAGDIWRADVEIHDFYFQRLEDEVNRKRVCEENRRLGFSGTH